ncbi:hypothetical protein D3C77_614080 [compost metagenome]
MQAFHVDKRKVRLLWWRLNGYVQSLQIITLRIGSLLMVKGVERIEKYIIRNNAACCLRSANFSGKGGRIPHQPRANLDVTENKDAAVLDSLRLAPT